ncbi:hypothetical protein K6U06_24440 [Acidiferrimicrobium sp. IK]|uniref:hypothetical protein n=1 Tax=Acidiferrimicrobium sp. IK TaxID=2871700 RepID=UPI0021CB51DF|nr:hypothetical protein [Acidiferrimicrobium sp. IK]MCU4187529.1 hypothetical protein [Acidiferrimicrobium sp. IK]
MRRTFWLAGILILTASAASACGGGTHHSTDPTTTLLPTTTSTTPSTLPPATTTTVPDPVNIPPTIDAAYVNAVLAQLNHVYGDAQRIEIATKFLPKSIPPLLRAIFGDAQYARELSVFSQALQGNQLDGLSPNAGDRKMTAVALSSNSTSCIQASIVADYRSVDPVAPPSVPGYVVLRPKISADDPQGVNRTPWMIFYESNQAPSSGDAC